MVGERMSAQDDIATHHLWLCTRRWALERFP
jgi:hypothetical protein